MINGSCHCGAVTFGFDDTPKAATSCNCSICRRLGTLWIYSDVENITISAEKSTIAYAYGKKNLAIHSCQICGCTTHWENLRNPTGEMAVNLNLAEPEVVSSIPVRHFDGADTWEFLD